MPDWRTGALSAPTALFEYISAQKSEYYNADSAGDDNSPLFSFRGNQATDKHVNGITKDKQGAEAHY